MTRQRFSIAVWLVFCLMLSAVPNAVAMPSPIEAGPAPINHDAISGAIRFAQAQPAPAPAAAPSPAQPAADEPIGNVATLTGSATVTRNNSATPLKLQDDIFLNDVLATSANSTLGVTFNDATTFNLTANARIAVDTYVYEDGGQQNAALFDIAKGTVAFVAASVAKTGDMKISTPTATLGIRGTTGLVEVPEGASAANPNNVAIKLYPDLDGHVGRIEVNDRAGVRLGFLTQGASGFAIRPGAMGRLTAAPLTISPQQTLRDQGIVRQVHAAQSIGRQVVSQQRALRQANPARNNLRNNQPNNQRNNPTRQPGLQKPDALPPRPGSPAQPGLQRQGVQQGAPGAQRPAGRTAPAQPRRLAAPPKGKPPPKPKR